MAKHPLVAVVGNEGDGRLVRQAMDGRLFHVSTGFDEEFFPELARLAPPFVVVFGHNVGHVGRRTSAVRALLPAARILAVHLSACDSDLWDGISDFLTESGADLVSHSRTIDEVRLHLSRFTCNSPLCPQRRSASADGDDLKPL